jgi:hypothetical protein
MRCLPDGFSLLIAGTTGMSFWSSSWVPAANTTTKQNRSSSRLRHPVLDPFGRLQQASRGSSIISLASGVIRSRTNDQTTSKLAQDVRQRRRLLPRARAKRVLPQYRGTRAEAVRIIWIASSRQDSGIDGFLRRIVGSGGVSRSHDDDSPSRNIGNC